MKKILIIMVFVLFFNLVGCTTLNNYSNTSETIPSTSEETTMSNDLIAEQIETGIRSGLSDYELTLVYCTTAEIHLCCTMKDIPNEYPKFVEDAYTAIANATEQFDVGLSHIWLQGDVDDETYACWETTHGKIGHIDYLEKGKYLYPIHEPISREYISDYLHGKYDPDSVLKEAPRIGMTSVEVEYSTWGIPEDVNRTTTAYGVREQWVYKHGYIYFENGLVTAIQD